MKITLYTPSGMALRFTNGEIESTISPDITFTGEDEMGRIRHITTSLPFLNEHEQLQEDADLETGENRRDLVDKVIAITDKYTPREKREYWPAFPEGSPHLVMSAKA